MNKSNSDNGSNTKRQGTEHNGRDTRGRFTKGNAGGPGNPFARRTAELRKMLLDTVTDQDMRQAARKLVELAKGGDVAAAKLLFAYVIGKPADAVDPDRLDIDEMRLLEEQSTPPQTIHGVLNGMPAKLACSLTRSTWPYMVAQQCAPLSQGLEEMDQSDAERAQGETNRANKERRARQRPSANGPDGADRQAVRREDKGRKAEAAPAKQQPMTNGENEALADELAREMVLKFLTGEGGEQAT
jgi:hypothetical protein